MIDKDAKPTKLLWVDLEMTGLDPTKDVILEIAAEITDFNFKTLTTYESRVKQDYQLVKARMSNWPWWNDFPASRDDLLANLKTGKPLELVEQDLIALVDEHFGAEPAILAGSSIHQDRRFIRKYWPQLDLKLHYRMLDVSAWKVLMQGKYGVEFEAEKLHRAFDDIHRSIAELQFYLDWFKNLS